MLQDLAVYVSTNIGLAQSYFYVTFNCRRLHREVLIHSADVTSEHGNSAPSIGPITIVRAEIQMVSECAITHEEHIFEYLLVDEPSLLAVCCS